MISITDEQQLLAMCQEVSSSGSVFAFDFQLGHAALDDPNRGLLPMLMRLADADKARHIISLVAVACGKKVWMFQLQRRFMRPLAQLFASAQTKV